jgi:murein L,D-transpeptidase YcbB/YkuD
MYLNNIFSHFPPEYLYKVQWFRRLLLRKLILITIALIWAYGFAEIKIVVAQTLSNQVSEQLRNLIEVAETPPKITVQGELIHTLSMLSPFYERRAYQPAWIGDNGPFPQVDSLLKAIREADREGLRPSDYHLVRIEFILKEMRQNQEQQTNLSRIVDLDLLLTDAFLLYGSHLLAGRINPETIDPEWSLERREVGLVEVLQTALDSNRIEEALKDLITPQPCYAKLRQALARYRDIAAKGGWPTVPDGPKMQKGDSDERVLALRARLTAADVPDQELNSNRDQFTPFTYDFVLLFDDALEQAVRKFQQRYGLEVDGIVGPRTLAAMNVTVEERIRQIELNMERWRWLPRDFGRRHILVNIANFELDVVEDGQTVMTMHIIVGKPYQHTPIFSADMTYLVFNPSWYVPLSIAKKEVLPSILKDPEYLAKRKIRVYQGGDDEATEIDPQTIDWSNVNAENFPYRFRQAPGAKNLLGRVKFMFPNQFNVYLHDTPSKSLFSRTVRAFSHGCIRIEKPIELAEYVLRGDEKWNREKILATIKKGRERTVQLPEPIPVYLLYCTVLVNEDGSIQFRNDIYGRDKELDKALRKKTPTL